MKIKKISTKVSLIATNMVIVSALLVTIASLITYRNDTIKSKAADALNIASCIAVTIDPVQYANVIESGEQNDYYNTVFKQLSTIKQETGALYVYVMDANYDDTSIQYFVEGYLPGEAVETYLGVEDDIDAFADEMYESMESGSLTMTDVYDSGGYGLAISGFAPVKDNSGNVLAVVGIDIGLSDVSNNVLYFAGRMAIILLIVIAALSWIPVVYVTRSVSRPLQALCAASDQIAKGIVDVNIPDIKSVDEVGQLANSFTRMLGTTKDKTEALDAIANGDLSVDVNLLSAEDIMGLEMQRMIDSLNSTFAKINGVSADIAESAENVSASSMNLAQGATEQTAAVAALGQSITKVAEKTLESAHMAMDAAKLGDTIKHNAEKGTQQMEQMLDAVKQITDASASIGNVIKVIDDIAFQTNILALNAAVEAARAGQHGKGFAVVAEEVRNLAAKSAEAAKDTGSLIENSIQKADLGAKIATATSSSLAEIVAGINESSKIINIIAESSKNQTDSIKDINVGISQVGEVVHLISKGAELSSSASASMNEESNALNLFVSNYKLKGK